MIDAVSLARPQVQMPSLEGANQTAAPNAGMSFGNVLQQTTADAINSMATAEKAAIDGINGKLGTREVVDAIMQAERSMQTTIAIRDKLVSAYHELSRMAI